MLSRQKCALLERLWREQARIMRAYLIGRTGDVVEADDAVAEVYWRACRALARNRVPRRNARGWLWQILHHYRIDRARRRARTPVQLPWSESHASLAGPEGRERGQLAAQLIVEPPDAVLLEARARLHRGLGRLPRRQAQLVVWRHFQGYSLAECAVAAGISYNAAKALHHRALLGLRRVMREGEGVIR